MLLDSGIACIDSEWKIRGSLERPLALNIDELKACNTLDNAARNALSFLLNRHARFHAYLNGPDVDTGCDRLFFNSTVMRMADAGFDRFLIDGIYPRSLANMISIT